MSPRPVQTRPIPGPEEEGTYPVVTFWGQRIRHPRPKPGAGRLDGHGVAYARQLATCWKRGHGTEVSVLARPPPLPRLLLLPCSSQGTPAPKASEIHGSGPGGEGVPELHLRVWEVRVGGQPRPDSVSSSGNWGCQGGAAAGAPPKADGEGASESPVRDARRRARLEWFQEGMKSKNKIKNGVPTVAQREGTRPGSTRAWVRSLVLIRG